MPFRPKLELVWPGKEQRPRLEPRILLEDPGLPYRAARWCAHATKYERLNGGKPWSYVLIPHDRIAANQTLAGLVAAHTRVARMEPQPA